MEVTFTGPVFFSETDEAMFFAWLERVPGFVSVQGHGSSLTVSFASERGAIAELLIVLRRWQIDPAPLQPLRSEDPHPSSLWERPIHEVAAGASEP
ncbi:hypothetical protein [Cognatilysobacter segetis]|uniref:hypothetical protein n=1 Tax=Cognatilysobacter segetis TaxID=2492394 RepID=UPI00105B72C6|nr:hypothetical protein [Lysobacter segetis]